MQKVGIYCSKTDHHPEWTITNGGRNVEVKLTSHFANNKVTLFDFELAEKMNGQYKITLKTFRMYPIIDDKTWASVKIFVAAFILGSFALQFFTHLGNYYPSSTQRGQAPQSTQFRPLIVEPYNFYSGNMHTDRDAELYTKAYVDDYAFKTQMFTARR